MFSALDQKFRHERRPAGLMAGADTRAGVAVEVLVEWNEVVPQRVRLKQLDAAKDRTPAVRVPEKDP